jgi:hypothetical protein
MKWGQAIWKFIQQDYHTIEDLTLLLKIIVFHQALHFLKLFFTNNMNGWNYGIKKKSNCFYQNGCLCQIWLL